MLCCWVPSQVWLGYPKQKEGAISLGLFFTSVVLRLALLVRMGAQLSSPLKPLDTLLP